MRTRPITKAVDSEQCDLSGLRSSGNILSGRVRTEKTVPEVESVGALSRQINETVNPVTKSSVLGTTNGSVWQLPVRVGARNRHGIRWRFDMGL